MRRLLLTVMVCAVAGSAALADKPTVHKEDNSLNQAKELKVQEPKESRVGIPAFMDTEKNRQLQQRLNRIPKRTHDGRLPSSHVVEAGKMTLKLANVAVSSNPDAATIVLITDDTFEDGSGVWGDDTGYHLLLCSTHDIDWETDLEDFGGGVCDFQDVYSKFDYKLPEDAEGLCTTENAHVVGTISFEVPAGVYDVLITNPNYLVIPDVFEFTEIFIAGNGAFDDLEFKNGVTYTFFVTILGMGDYVTVIADDGSMAPDAPESMYLPPVGTLYHGRSIDREMFANDARTHYITDAYASAYSTWTFKNLTNKLIYEQNALWLYADVNDDYSAEATNLVMDVTNGDYTMPELHTCIVEDCTSYIHGATTYSSDAYLSAGGGNYDDGTISIGFTNANPDLGYTAYRFGDNNFMFGTGTSSADMEGLISYYACDPDKYIYFEGVSVHFSTLTGPADTELKLTIAKASKSATGGLIIGDTVGVGKITIADALFAYDNASGALSFNQFFSTDEFGFEAPVDYLEIQGSFALILTGYNVEGVALAVVSEIEDRPEADTERYAYLLGKDGKYYSYTYYYNTMLFQLESVYYSYITSETTAITADGAGGDYAVKLVPYFNGAWVENENELPDWLDVTFEDNFVSGDWHTMANIAVDANDDSSDRSFDIEFATWGARHIITVSQTGATGLSAIKVAHTNIVKKGDNFELTYTPDYSAVSVYNVAGQKLAGYELPATGTFTVPSGNYPQGIYLFKFSGAKGASTVKALK